MSAPLLFARDGRTLPFVPVTLAALEAIRAAVPTKRLAYARSLYVALLEAANEARGDRAAVTRKALGEAAGCSKELVSDLRPLLEAAGVLVVNERSHGGQTLEHEWIVVEPDPTERPPVPDGPDPLGSTEHGGRAPQAQGSQEEKNDSKGGNARASTPAIDARSKPPADFPEELQPHARAVYRLLKQVAEDQPNDVRKVWPKAVCLAIMAHPRHPVVGTAHALAQWAVDPPRPIRDVVATYRTFLGKERELAGTEKLTPDGVPTAAPSANGATPRGAAAAGADWATRERLKVMQGGVAS